MSFSPRRLYLILGDQLDHDSSLLREMDPVQDLIWMAEVAEEGDYVWSHKLRLAFFFAAMRHFRDHLRERGFRVHYTELPADPAADRGRGLRELLALDLGAFEPDEVVLVEAGDHRVRGLLKGACEEAAVPLRLLADTHFLLPREDFGTWAKGRKSFLLEHFYRMMRKRTGILMDEEGQPEGGTWNFDHDNREAFGRAGPPPLPDFGCYPADAITAEGVAMVNERYSSHPLRMEQ
ncbi:MAG: cryptochrome/photolyase family protein, partial [Verrucomicrobiales bacterium]|nr:cryptochrome/photolyase family protein [Verrucomicrobiales bacterium]